MDYHDFVSSCGAGIRGESNEVPYADFIEALPIETRLQMPVHFERAQSEKLLILSVRNDGYANPVLWIGVPGEAVS